MLRSRGAFGWLEMLEHIALLCEFIGFGVRKPYVDVIRCMHAGKHAEHGNIFYLYAHKCKHRMSIHVYVAH